MKQKIMVLIVFLLSLLSFSCNKNNINAKSKKKEYKIPIYDDINYKRLNLSLGEKLADYEWFWGFIYNGYPYLEVCQRKGVALNKIKNEGYKKLKDLKFKSDYGAFYSKLCGQINDGYPMGHFWSLSYGEYEEFFFECFRPPVKNKDGSRNEKIINYYKSIPFDFESYPNQRLLPSIGSLIPNINIIEKNKIAYISIKSFKQLNTSIIDQYHKDINEFVSETHNYKHLIIDISKNSGGYNKHWHYLVGTHLNHTLKYRTYSLLIDSKYTNLQVKDVMQKNNCINIEDVPNIKNAQLTKANKACYKDYCIEPQYWNIKKPRFDRKIWVLIGNQTFSAADRFAGFCKQTNWATLVGENTSGAGMNAEGMYAIALPNSGFLIKCDLGAGLNNKGYVNDEYGTIPDIYTAEGKTALETCLDAIEEYDNNNTE